MHITALPFLILTKHLAPIIVSFDNFESGSNRTSSLLFGPRREKTCLRGFANNTGADQPAHPRILISAFVIRVILSTISKLAPSKIALF